MATDTQKLYQLSSSIPTHSDMVFFSEQVADGRFDHHDRKKTQNKQINFGGHTGLLGIVTKPCC